MTTEQVLMSRDGADGTQQPGDATPPPAPPLNTESPALVAIKLVASSGRGFGSESNNLLTVGLVSTLENDVKRLRSELCTTKAMNLNLSQDLTDAQVKLATLEAGRDASHAGNTLARFCLFLTTLLTPIALELFQSQSQRMGIVLGVVAGLLALASLLAPSRLLSKLGRSAP